MYKTKSFILWQKDPYYNRYLKAAISVRRCFFPLVWINCSAGSYHPGMLLKELEYAYINNITAAEK